MSKRDAPTTKPAKRAERDGAASGAPETPDFIAENLRRLFGAVESEALPDRFTELLDRLAREDREK